MIFAGIDGCKAGWLLITYHLGIYNWHIVPHIDELPQYTGKNARVFIDIPIGLASEKFPRTIEKRLRAELGNRSSTVFSVPVRAAVYEPDRDRAKQINSILTGKSLSEQSLNIKDKILEVDQFVQKKSDSLALIESHPELCFKYLKGSILQSKKSEKEGIEERLELIASFDTDCASVFKTILQNTLRKHVKPDDITDALVLCLANHRGSQKRLNFLRDSNQKDELEIDIQIAFYKEKK